MFLWGTSLQRNTKLAIVGVSEQCLILNALLEMCGIGTSLLYQQLIVPLTHCTNFDHITSAYDAMCNINRLLPT